MKRIFAFFVIALLALLSLVALANAGVQAKEIEYSHLSHIHI